MSRVITSGPGLDLFLDGGKLLVDGKQESLQSVMPFIRKNRAAIISYLYTMQGFRSCLSGIRAFLEQQAHLEKRGDISRQWMVDTSDRGTIKVTCSPPHTLVEILGAVPGAVSAGPLVMDQF